MFKFIGNAFNWVKNTIHNAIDAVTSAINGLFSQSHTLSDSATQQMIDHYNAIAQQRKKENPWYVAIVLRLMYGYFTLYGAFYAAGIYAIGGSILWVAFFAVFTILMACFFIAV